MQVHIAIDNGTSHEVKGITARLQQVEETRSLTGQNSETNDQRTVAELRWKDVTVPSQGAVERDLYLHLPTADLLTPSLATAHVSVGYYLELVVHMSGFLTKDLLASLNLALVPSAALTSTSAGTPGQ